MKESLTNIINMEIKTKIPGEKFRIKVVEKNNGEKFYCPQIYVVTKTSLSFLQRMAKRFNGEEEVIREWRGFISSKDGYDILWRSEDGVGSSEQENAEKMIYQYIIDDDIRMKKYLSDEKMKREHSVKKISYIEM